jgi:hypothetical protein
VDQQAVATQGQTKYVRCGGNREFVIGIKFKKNEVYCRVDPNAVIAGILISRSFS